MLSKESVLCFCLIVILFSCRNDDSNFEDIVNDSKKGSYLRVIEASAESFDRHQLESILFELNLEVVNSQSGPSLESVDVFVTYIPNSPGTNPIPEPLISISIEDFVNDINSELPRYVLSITSAAVLAALTLDAVEVFPEDVFRIEWTANLSDGQSFQASNTGISVKGQPFYNAPFVYDVVVNCDIGSPDYAVGLYDLVVYEDGITGVTCVFDLFGCSFFENGEVELQVASHPNQRTFRVNYLNKSISVYFDLDCGAVSVPDQNSGLVLSCGDGMRFITNTNTRAFDVENDNSIGFEFTPYFAEDCGLPFTLYTRHTEMYLTKK